MSGAPPGCKHGLVSPVHTGTIDFYYQNPVDCTLSLMSQPCFAPYLSYSPVEQFDTGGSRMYSKLETADKWWKTRSKLPDGATLIPTICSSDATHLTDNLGDKKVWPIILAIGKLTGRIRNSPTKYTRLLIPLLPVFPKLTSNPSAHERQRAWNSWTLYNVLHPILRHLIDIRTVAGSGLRTN